MARLLGRPRAASGGGQRRIIVPVAFILALVSAQQVPQLKNDPAVYLDAVHRMRQGSGYYRAMDAAMQAFGIGPVESTRAFRPPTAFVLWRWLPSDRYMWMLFLALVVVATAAMASVVRAPYCALLFAGYLIVVGMDGYSSPDLWAVPLMAIGLALAWHRRPLPALAVLLLATTFRELAVLAVIGVVIDGWHRPRVRAAAAGCGALLAALVLLHARGADPFLVAAGEGREARFWGSAHVPASPFELAGAWLPGGVVLGVGLLVLTLLWLRTAGRTWLLVPLLALVLTGLVAHRPEWGMLIVPFTLCMGVDQLVSMRSKRAGGVAQASETSRRDAPADAVS